MGWKRLVSGLILLLITSGSLWAKAPFSIWFLDVGEGDAIYFESSTGENGLIDTGNVITGNRVLQFLQNRGVNSLDLLLITHPHPDHMGGVFQILQHIEVHQRFDNGQSLPTNEERVFYRWYGEFFRKENYTILQRGDQLSLGNIKLKILNPHQLQSDWNSNSLVILLTHNHSKILLMGDGTIPVEQFLLKNEPHLKADLIKIGHHGASDSSNPEFLKALEPRYAIVSVNQNNIRGYPSAKTFKTLQKLGITSKRTDKDGTIRFIEKKGVLQLQLP